MSYPVAALSFGSEPAAVGSTHPAFCAQVARMSEPAIASDVFSDAELADIKERIAQFAEEAGVDSREVEHKTPEIIARLERLAQTESYKNPAIKQGIFGFDRFSDDESQKVLRDIFLYAVSCVAFDRVTPNKTTKDIGGYVFYSGHGGRELDIDVKKVINDTLNNIENSRVQIGCTNMPTHVGGSTMKLTSVSVIIALNSVLQRNISEWMQTFVHEGVHANDIMSSNLDKYDEYGPCFVMLMAEYRAHYYEKSFENGAGDADSIANSIYDNLNPYFENSECAESTQEQKSRQDFLKCVLERGILLTEDEVAKILTTATSKKAQRIQRVAAERSGVNLDD